MEMRKTLFSKEYGALRTVITDNDILFCAIDIARMLGYKRPDKAISNSCMNIRLYKFPTTGGDQYIRFITDDEAIRLARRCTLPGSDRFCDALYSAIAILEDCYFSDDNEDNEPATFDFEDPDSDDSEHDEEEDGDLDDLEDMSDLSVMVVVLSLIKKTLDFFKRYLSEEYDVDPDDIDDEEADADDEATERTNHFMDALMTALYNELR